MPSAAFVAGRLSTYGRQPYSRRSACRRRTVCSAEARSSRTVALIGATSGVGRHIVAMLADNPDLNLRLVTRNSRAARELQEQHPATTLAVADVTDGSTEGDDKLSLALRGAEVVVITIGTTAFPTRRWLDRPPPPGGPIVSALAVLAGFIRITNSPDKVEATGTARLMRSLDENTTRKVILLSSIGTRRASQFPFPILNLFGVLDAKRAAENSVIQNASAKGYAYTIVRPGRLVGGPHTNPGMFWSEPSDKMQGIVVARGDTISGDVSRKTVAKAVVAALLAGPSSDNVDFGVVNAPGSEEASFDWDSRFRQLQQPVMAAKFDFETVDDERLSAWVRQWSASVTTSGALFPPLPLPVRVDYPEDCDAQFSFLSVSVKGDVNLIGSLRLKIERHDGLTSLCVVRNPSRILEPFPGERQLIDQLGDDLSLVVRGA